MQTEVLIGILAQMDILHLVLQGRDIDTMLVGDAAQGYSALEPRAELEKPNDAVVDGTGIGPVVENGSFWG